MTDYIGHEGESPLPRITVQATFQPGGRWQYTALLTDLNGYGRQGFTQEQLLALRYDIDAVLIEMDKHANLDS